MPDQRRDQFVGCEDKFRQRERARESEIQEIKKFTTRITPYGESKHNICGTYINIDVVVVVVGG